jgi:hypothetical protein
MGRLTRYLCERKCADLHRRGAAPLKPNRGNESEDTVGAVKEVA